MSITTITIDAQTRQRLVGYKHGDWTFDDVINMLMDRVSMEDLSEEHIREHLERLKDFKGISKDDFKKRIRKKHQISG